MMMSQCAKEIVDHKDHGPYVPTLALHGPFSFDHNCAHYQSALPFGLTFRLDPLPGQSFPYGQFPCFQLHGALGACDYSFEPAFIRKRNERERHRVRCVNAGYARLREHLPQEFEDKRLSKVETLRAAINYIKQLEGLLEFNAPRLETEKFNASRLETEKFNASRLETEKFNASRLETEKFNASRLETEDDERKRAPQETRTQQ